MDNPFDFAVTDNHSYSPSKFYTASSSGGGSRTTVRLQDWIDDALSGVRKQYPVYSNLSEFIRDCIVHRLHALTSDDPEFVAMRAKYEAWAAVAEDRDEQVRIRTVYQACLDDWHNAETEHEISRAKRQIENVINETLDPEWKRRFAAITNKK